MAGVSSSAQGASYRVQRAVICDDVTDDVCQGGLLIALPHKMGPNIGFNLVVRGDARRRQGAYCWQGPWDSVINLGCRSAGLLAGELAGVLFGLTMYGCCITNVWNQENSGHKRNACAGLSEKPLWHQQWGGVPTHSPKARLCLEHTSESMRCSHPRCHYQ